MSKIISEVHLYQGVKFGSSVIRYVLMDSAYSDKTQCQGNTAEVAEGVGIRISNARLGEEIIVPFNNVSFFKLVPDSKMELKKAK